MKNRMLLVAEELQSDKVTNGSTTTATQRPSSSAPGVTATFAPPVEPTISRHHHEWFSIHTLCGEMSLRPGQCGSPKPHVCSLLLIGYATPARPLGNELNPTF